MAGPLRQFIRANYGSVERYAEECTTINRLRQDMRGAGRDDTGRDLLYRYYGQLELLELRFPIDEDHVRISFTWYDAFTDNTVSQYSLAYEKACVLFNIASILSFTASNQTRSDVDGMKKAYHSYQACAGLLNFVNDNFLHAPSTDLSREMVKTLSQVMLAQAQEVFTEKQIRDSGKSSIIAKLAAETANLYHNANETLTELAIAGNIDAIWGPYCQVKENYFAALAHYHQACFEEEKAKYGLSIARFATAETLIKEALAQAKSHSGQFSRYPCLSNDPGPAIVDLLKAQQQLIAERGTAARKENDVIYHDTVVKESAVPAVSKLASAKPISLHDLYAGQDVSRIIGYDIFRKLVPLSVHESASLYSEEIAKLLRGEQERSDVADSELSTAFDYLGLPKSLHQLKLTDERRAQDLTAAPSDLKSLATQIAQSERGSTLDSRFTAVQQLRQQIDNRISHISRVLDEESRQCEAMRSQYFEIWTQAPSDSLTIGMREDLKNYRKSLSAATASDDQMRSELESVRPELKVLCSNDPEQLDSVFRNIILRTDDKSTSNQGSLLDLPEEENSNELAIKIDQVDDNMRKLLLVKKERLQTLQDLKEKARNDDISDVLVLNKKTPGIEQRVFASELEKFKPHQNRISATISRQEQLLEEMTATFTSVLEDKSNQAKQRKWTSVTRQRKETIAKMEKAGNTYQDLALGMTKASKFYNDLNGLMEALEQHARQFLSQRQQEGRRMLDTTVQQKPQQNSDILRQQLERMNIGTGLAQRPQPPPPSPYQRR